MDKRLPICYGGKVDVRQPRFTLTEDHVKLLRRANVGWERAEYGAPGIDPKRPYGNGDVTQDLMEILGWDIPADDDWNGPGLEVCEALRRLHVETETALQIVLATGSFEPGVYVAEPYNTMSWRRET